MVQSCNYIDNTSKTGRDDGDDMSVVVDDDDDDDDDECFWC